MKGKQPEIGVYLPTHNRVELLKRAVDSVLAQTYQNFKLMIVDDGSSDGTFEYLKSLKDPRISFLRNEVPEKACRARNRAIEALDTELVTGLDDDDIFLPNRLERLLSIYSDDYSFVCGGYYWDYGAHKKALFTTDMEISLSDAFDLNQCSNQILARRDRILAVGGFDAELSALQDHDLWVRLIQRFGTAYRLGEALYVVNDDHSLERISSVNNKLNAIRVFEEKHAEQMSDRNRANFAFYRKRILSEKMSLKELLASYQHGIKGLKTRYFVSQALAPLSKARLTLLRSNSKPLNFITAYLAPLIATGGPGASRVILLSACIYFLGANDSANFSSDFFIIMLLNTAFSQSFGFFLLKPEFHDSFQSVVKSSLWGLLLSLACVAALYGSGLLESWLYSSCLIGILHFYYLYRFRYIALQRFVRLAFVECIISLCCLLLPMLAAQNELATEASKLPYQLYLAASLAGLIILVLMTRMVSHSAEKSVSFKRVGNIAISTSASIFAVFILPAAIKGVVPQHLVSLIALSISCISVTLLIPRTYANKIMSKLADENVRQQVLGLMARKYSKLVFVSMLLGLIITLSYMSYINSSDLAFWPITTAIGVLLLCSQLGFVHLTTLSLRLHDKYVAKLNLVTLLINACLILFVTQYAQSLVFVYYTLAFACMAFLMRNIFAKVKLKQLFHD